MTDYTTNYNIPLPAFSGDPWSQDYYDGFNIVDAVLFALSGVTDIAGVWDNSTAYTVGQRAIDDTDGTVWQCATGHTSASSGTFSADRTANPTYWTSFGFYSPTQGRKLAFSTTTTDSDPGAGVLRFNHATFASITSLFIDNLDAGGADITAWLDSMDDVPNASIRGVIQVEVQNDPTIYAIFYVNGSVTDGTGYRKVAVTPVSQDGTIGNGVTLVVTFAPAGADGAGSMDAAVYDPGGVADDAFDTDNHSDGIVNGVYTLTERAKLAAIEAAADVTDATNVASALANGVEGLTTSEVNQLKNLNAVVVTNAQWSYLGGAGAYAATLLATADEAAFKAAVNLEIGTDVLAMSGGTLTGELNLADNLLTRPKIKDYGEAVNAVDGSGGGTKTFDMTLGNIGTITIQSATTTLAISNPAASGVACTLTLIITNGGSQTVNHPTGTIWPGGSAPSLSAAGVDVVSYMTIDGGTTWYGFTGGLNFS